ncbi:MAG: hypothetical protein U5L09_19575 [Bacteroidales bacterium]|nr:hypothetical protein [Bacteroidales bacterium]
MLTEEYINDSLETQKEKELAMQLNRRIDFRVLRKDFEAETDPTKTGKKSAVALIKDPASNKVNYIPGKGTSILLPVIINGYAYNVSFSKDNGDLVISPDLQKACSTKA